METSSDCAALVKVRLHSDVIRTGPPSGLADPAVIGLFLTGCPVPVTCRTAPLCTFCIALVHTDFSIYIKESQQQQMAADVSTRSCFIAPKEALHPVTRMRGHVGGVQM